MTENKKNLIKEVIYPPEDTDKDKIEINADMFKEFIEAKVNYIEFGLRKFARKLFKSAEKFDIDNIVQDAIQNTSLILLERIKQNKLFINDINSLYWYFMVIARREIVKIKNDKKRNIPVPEERMDHIKSGTPIISKEKEWLIPEPSQNIPKKDPADTASEREIYHMVFHAIPTQSGEQLFDPKTAGKKEEKMRNIQNMLPYFDMRLQGYSYREILKIILQTNDSVSKEFRETYPLIDYNKIIDDDKHLNKDEKEQLKKAINRLNVQYKRFIKYLDESLNIKNI